MSILPVSLFIIKYLKNGIKLNVSDIGYIEIEDVDKSTIEMSNICEYVHKLQNLYFALTGDACQPLLHLRNQQCRQLFTRLDTQFLEQCIKQEVCTVWMVCQQPIDVVVECPNIALHQVIAQILA